jgi:DNA-binding winged helix-turn-helix (wHTH) protein/tetratricopeptide (TPR) repeat protein
VSVIRFGIFEAHLASGELFKSGRRIRLQQQPFAVLSALLERPGEVVTREDLRKAIWADGVTVDFDQSLNKSVTKLRDALGDLAASPRFIETLPKRGYRFIADVRKGIDGASGAGATGAVIAGPRLSKRLALLWLPAGAVVALVIGTFALLSAAGPSQRVEAHAAPPRMETKAATRSPIYAARDAYERGRAALARRSEESLRLGLDHFARAVALSPRYAEAYVGLADSWSLLASYGLADPREAMPRARDAANRALVLDARMARAHASLGRTAMIFDWDWPTAAWHFERALALDPGDATTHQWYAYFLSGVSRHDEAIAEARRAVAAEPLSLTANTALGYVLYLARRHDEAAAQLERTLTIDPDFAQARRDLALVRVQQGRLREAVVELKRVATLNDGSAAAQAELAWAQALSGDTASARQRLADLERRRTTRYVPSDALALGYAGVGETDQALSWLQRGLSMRVAALAHLPVEPIWDVLRRDPRLRQMTDTVNATLP